MSTKLATDAPAVPQSAAGKRTAAARLAIYGGPREVTVRYRERWRPIRAPEIAKILIHAAAGVSTRVASAGPNAAFEHRFASLTETRYALAMNSGTAALHSAFFAVGVKPGDEVIVPSYTFYASASPILQCGGRPVFCDVDAQTLTADPDDVVRRITPRTKAICVVHVWGNPARMDRFREIQQQYGIAIVEDCSHAHGARFMDQPVGSWGDVGCFSLQGAKPVSGGEAGIAVTNNPTLYDRMLVLGHYPRPGTDQKANTFDIGRLSLGVKYRPHLYAILLASGALSRLPELNRLRTRNYEILASELQDCGAVQPVATYPEAKRRGFLEFVLKYNPQHAGGWPRGAFVQAAKAEGVPIVVDRYKPLHRQPLFSSIDLGRCGGYVGVGMEHPLSASQMFPIPVTEDVCYNTLSMPPLTKVSEKFVHQCGRALRKVAEAAATMRDFRLGR